MSDLTYFPQAGLCHEDGDTVRGAEPRAVARMKDAGKEAMECLFSRGEVNHMDGTPGPEDTAHLKESKFPHRGLEVVEHEGGQHSVERGVRIGKLLGEAQVELDRGGLAFGFSPSPIQRLRIGVEPDNLGFGMSAFEKNGHIAGPAANLKHAIARMDIRLIDQPPVG